MAITSEQVRELREKTGAGMMDCKRALEEAQGRMDEAVSLLREKGLASAAKKAGRVASEGLVAAAVSEHRVGSLVELNCETDFVAKNEDFKTAAGDLARIVAAGDNIDVTAAGEGAALQGLKLPNGATVADTISSLVAKIGENISVRRYARFAVSAGTGAIEAYIHLGGKIGVLIELSCEKADTVSSPVFLALAKDLAMQVAAARPQYVKREEVPAEVIAGERSIYKAQAMNEGKPEQVAEKIMAGRLEKFYKETCLVEQAFIKDPNRNCTAVMQEVAAQLGDKISVTRFARFERGEGLEKKSQDLAAEVAAQINK